MSLIKFCHILDMSGRDQLLFNSIKYSSRDRFEYSVVTLAPTGELKGQMKGLGVECLSLDHISRRQSLSSFWKLFNYFRKNNIQVVQTHLMDSSIIGLAAAKLAGVPVRIFSGHHSAEIALTDRRLLKFVDSFSPKFTANHTIAPSESMKKIFTHDLRVPQKKITVIHHGIDLDTLRNSAERPTNIRKELGLLDKTIFLAAGRLNWVKDFRTMINGFAEVAADRIDVVLLIAGAGDQSDLKKQIDEKRISDKVFLLGPREDLPSLMKESDVFLHASLEESFGMVYIEAFALGKPIICTPTGIAVDIVKDGVNGYFFEPGNSVKLSEVISKVLNNKQGLALMGENGKRISEEFAVQRTQAAFSNIVSGWVETKD